MQGTGITKKPSTLMKHLILISFVILNLNILAREIEETTFSYWNKPDSQIYYSTPKTIDADTKIIFIMHGASRGAKKYLNDWLPLAKDRNVVFIAQNLLKNLIPSMFI